MRGREVAIAHSATVQSSHQGGGGDGGASSRLLCHCPFEPRHSACRRHGAIALPHRSGREAMATVPWSHRRWREREREREREKWRRARERCRDNKIRGWKELERDGEIR